MAINLTTPASPTLDPARKTRILFGPTSTSNNSSTFSVTTQPYYLQAYSLAGDDVITVQMTTGAGSGTRFEDYAPLGVPVVLNSTINAIRLDWPGMYRAVHTGSSSFTAIYVVAFEGTMTEESTIPVASTNQA